MEGWRTGLEGTGQAPACQAMGHTLDAGQCAGEGPEPGSGSLLGKPPATGLLLLPKTLIPISKLKVWEGEERFPRLGRHTKEYFRRYYVYRYHSSDGMRARWALLPPHPGPSLLLGVEAIMYF